jgi:hypothetical protein
VANRRCVTPNAVPLSRYQRAEDLVQDIHLENAAALGYIYWPAVYLEF